MKKNFAVGILVLAVAVPVSYFGWLQYQNHKLDLLVIRANAYWSAKVANDLVTAYQLEAATVAGQLAPDEVEQHQYHGMRMVGYDLGSAKLLPDGGEIMVEVTATTPFGVAPRKGARFADHWTWMKGDWFHGYPQKGGSGLEKDPAPGTLKGGGPSFLEQKTSPNAPAL